MTLINNISKEIVYYGKPEKLPELKQFRAGDLSVFYENGSLRYIKAGRTEIIRMIYSAVRDRNWGTIPFTITNENISGSSDSFRIQYDCLYQEKEISFFAHFSIIGENNRITFEMKGEALTSFLKNRIGFCVLHPIEECKGRIIKITNPEGKTEIYKFPESISPHQPFKNISSMEWDLEGGSKATIKFSGDIFETEDQRNWSDASYKTYCTPLDIPFPAKIEKGTKVSQKIELSFSGNIFKTTEEEAYSFKFSDDISSIPSIGLAASSEKEELSDEEVNLLKEIGLGHYKVDLKLDSNWKGYFQQKIKESRELGLPIELVLHISNIQHISNKGKEVTNFISFVVEHQPQLRSITVVDANQRLTTPELIEKVIPQIKQALNVAVGGGVDAYFTELNRSNLNGHGIDFVTYTLCPQVHAFDNRSLVENLKAQEYTVESAKRLYPEKDILVSSVTLKQRFNVVATSESREDSNVLPSQVDPRQMSLFGASWTLVSLKYLIEAGVKSVTYYETVGKRGVMYGQVPLSHPQQFFSGQGNIFPVYHIFKSVLEEKDAKVRHSISSHPLIFDGIVIDGKSGQTIILGNFSSREITISLRQLKGSMEKSFLDETISEKIKTDKDVFLKLTKESINEKITIKPYGILKLKINRV